MTQKTVSLSEELYNSLAKYAKGKGLTYGGKPSVSQAIEDMYNEITAMHEYSGVEYIGAKFMVAKKNGTWYALNQDDMRTVYNNRVKHNVVAWCLGATLASETKEKYG